jgi:hypothetical protein
MQRELPPISNSVSGSKSTIYTWDGTNFIAMTNPSGAVGDTDPDISADQSLIAFNRDLNGTNFNITTVTTAAPRTETNIFGPLSGTAFDGYPHFCGNSSNGLVLLWHVDGTVGKQIRRCRGPAAIVLPYCKEPQLIPNYWRSRHLFRTLDAAFQLAFCILHGSYMNARTARKYGVLAAVVLAAQVGS